MNDIQFCPSCGYQNKATAKFCKECGSKMPAPREATTEPVKEIKEETATPITETPVAPVTTEPEVPVIDEPEVSVIDEPAAPVIEPAVAPIIDTPAAPVVETPAAPVSPAKTAKEIKAEQKAAKENAKQAQKDAKIKAKADAKEAKLAAKLAKKANKKGGAGIVVLVLLMLVAIGGGVFSYLYFFTSIFSSPKDVVMLALSKATGPNGTIAILSDNTDKVNAPEYCTGPSREDFLKVINYTKENPSVEDVEITFENASLGNLDPSIAYGSTIAFHRELDRDEKLLYFNSVFKYGGIKLLDFDIFVDDADFSVTEKSFLDDGYLYFNTEDWIDDMKSSELFSSMIDELDSVNSDILDKLSFNIFDIMDKMIDLTEVNTKTDVSDALVSLYDSITVEKTGKYSNFTIGDTETKCLSYTVTIPEESINNLIDDFQPRFEESLTALTDYVNGIAELSNEEPDLTFEFDGKEYDLDEIDDYTSDICDYLSEFAKDITFTVYLTNKGDLVAIKYEDTLELEEDVTVEFYIEFLGDPNPNDGIYCDIYIETEDNSAEIVYTRTGNSTENSCEATQVFDMYSDDDQILVLTIENSYSEKSGDIAYEASLEIPDEKITVGASFEGSLELTDDSFEFEFDDLSCYAKKGKTKYSVSFSGLYSLGALDDDVQTPSGDKYDIFNMDEDDLEDLVNTIAINAMSSPLYSLITGLL